eukprot:TRINITY_DN4571_c0_g1_i1.p1 TRINITY_DN4571_c0_g1~~TRINITY_DN4571_c0_g1_i1.p1  ORF type:complete len:206 (-),score=57.70 TRINITY_DN4571_c0_g1_i1:56-652(-)
MNNLFGELKKFDTNKLAAVDTVVKVYKPHISKDMITDTNKPTTIETYEGETICLPKQQQEQHEEQLEQEQQLLEQLDQQEQIQSKDTIYLSPMEELLLSLGLKADNIDNYALLLEDRKFLTTDDLLLADLSIEQLDEIGICDEEDRQKLWAFLHPEQVPSPEPSPDELARLIMDSFLDPELTEIIRLKAEVDTLQQLK